jgi:hypothetical protein
MKRRDFLHSISAAVLLPLFLRQEGSTKSIALADPNEVICKRKFEYALSHHLREQPINEIIMEMAKSFLGVAYTANTLESAEPEYLIVNLQTLDCVTFYENSLALARCIKKNALTYGDLRKELQYIRYRGGIIDGYPSRLHYTSDYFFDNEKKGVLQNITKNIGGMVVKKNIHFMSTHSDSYLQLKENPEFVNVIAAQESEISKRSMYHIPKSKIKEIASQINNGDILGITTAIKGLDCSHTGIALWKNKKLYMIHASVPGAKVQITKTPLWDYLMNIKKDTGIIVARALEPEP